MGPKPRHFFFVFHKFFDTVFGYVNFFPNFTLNSRSYIGVTQKVAAVLGDAGVPVALWLQRYQGIEFAWVCRTKTQTN